MFITVSSGKIELMGNPTNYDYDDSDIPSFQTPIFEYTLDCRSEWSVEYIVLRHIYLMTRYQRVHWICHNYYRLPIGIWNSIAYLWDRVDPNQRDDREIVEYREIILTISRFADTHLMWNPSDCETEVIDHLMETDQYQ